MGTPVVLGLDMGGTKSAASLITPNGKVLARASAPTPATEGSSAVVAGLVELARTILTQKPDATTVLGVGISAGAPADATRGLVFEAPNLPGFGHKGVPLALLVGEALFQEIGPVPVRLENDADATALAEHRFGAGQGAQTMAFLTVGTGIGAGLILDGKLHRGMAGAGGEVGHIAVEAKGRACTCGLAGCLEAYASGPSLVRIAIERGFTGEPSGRAVVEAARQNDPSATFAVQLAASMLGRGIATLSMLINPEVVVLGTLAVHAGDLLLPTIYKTVQANTWPRIHHNLRIVPAALGDSAQDLAALCAFG